MKVMERRVLELEDSLNSFRESNMERLVGLESFKERTQQKRTQQKKEEDTVEERRGHSRRISELWAKINPVNQNISPENQQVKFTF